MTEKDNASMTTVQMKTDYAASEVYSTASEAPPAYKRQSNSVKIAKIAAFTIIISSFVLGAFILASSYLQAKASCDQVQALDSVLEKELMLETLQQVNKELPRAEALLGKENAEENENLQNLEKDEPIKKVEIKKEDAPAPVQADEANTVNDNSYSDAEEGEEMQKYPAKVPLELDLSDLAAALLQNNKKSRMNCVVERKHAEEIVDSPSKTVALPFGMNLTTDPKKARVTGERISIYCEGGNENKEDETPEGPKDNNREEDDDTDEDVETIRPMFIPFHRVNIPFGPIPQQFPLTHMPQRMAPHFVPQQQQQQQQPQPQQFPQFQQFQQHYPQQQPQSMIRQMPPPPPPFQQLPIRPPMPPQVMQAPHPEPQQRIVRIHVQQVPIREIHVADDVPVQIPAQRQELPLFQMQRVPLGLALERAGITAEDLANIQRITEERINEEFRRLASDSDEDSSNSSEEDDSNDAQTAPQHRAAEQERQQQLEQAQHAHQPEPAARMEQEMPTQRLILQPLPEQPRDTMTPPMPEQPMHVMQLGRAAFGRSLLQPVRIPVPMMQAQADMSQDASNSAVSADSERPHFVQPRSV